MSEKLSRRDVMRRSSVIDLSDPVCRSVSDVEQMDEWNEKKKDDVIAVLESQGGKDTREMVRRMMRRLMTSELLASFNRNGTDGKRKFCVVFEDLVKAAVRNVCAKDGVNFDEKVVEQRVAVVLKGASDKYGEKCRKSRHALNDSTRSV